MVAPSLRFLGGQSVQAQRLYARLAQERSVVVELLPVDPVLPGLLALLQRVKYVRTIATSLVYWLQLISRVPRADVVHAYSASYWSFLLAPVPAMLIGRLFAKRVILNYHSGEARDHLARFGWHVRPLARLAHLIVTPSQYLLDVFAEHGLHAKSIENALDVERFPYRRRETLPPRFLSNRNMEPMYDVGSVIKAFAIIQRTVPDASLTLAGDGSQRSALEQLTSSLSLRNVKFTGAVSPMSMPQLYDDASIFLNASRIDNMPLSLLEAFASGVPVVTTNAGGIPLIVRDRANGRVVAIGDPEALAEASLELLADPAAALRLADTAREECISRYTWDAVRDRWIAAYFTTPDARRQGQPIQA